MYVIYMDVLFFINFVMDLIIFYIVTMILNKAIKHRRHIEGSLIASILYCLLLYFPVLQKISYSVYSFFIPIIPILIIYRPNHLKQFVKIYVVSMLVAALIGGTTFSLWYMSGQYSRSLQTMSFLFLIIVGLGVGSIIYLSFYWIRRRLILPTFAYDLELIQGGMKVDLKALLDTGNCLYTPITHKPVVVVEYKNIKTLLSNEQIDQFNRYHDKIEELIEEGIKGPKALIPFNSIGCETGTLWGIEVEQLIVHKMQFSQKFSKCIIGISSTSLFNDHSYDALLHPDYILGGIAG